MRFMPTRKERLLKLKEHYGYLFYDKSSEIAKLNSELEGIKAQLSIINAEIKRINEQRE